MLFSCDAVSLVVWATLRKMPASVYFLGSGHFKGNFYGVLWRLTSRYSLSLSHLSLSYLINSMFSPFPTTQLCSLMSYFQTESVLSQK